jgi:hypothetical protein
MSTVTTAQPDVRRQARVALVLALLGVPGSTIAWGLPAGGFWIGMPLAAAAIVVGIGARAASDRVSRRMATAAIVLATVEILFMVTWTVAS